MVALSARFPHVLLNERDRSLNLADHNRLRESRRHRSSLKPVPGEETSWPSPSSEKL